jgi:hypothetical protein
MARLLGMSSNACIFGGSMRKVLQLSSNDSERILLQEVGDSFGFPIMEEELSKESAEKF